MNFRQKIKTILTKNLTISGGYSKISITRDIRTLPNRDIKQGKISLPAPRPNKFYVYTIKCNNNSIYIGQTENLPKRWKEHCDGKVNWTKQHKPIEVVHWEEFNSLEEAIKREHNLKTGFGRKWLKRLVASRQAGKTSEMETLRTREMERPAADSFKCPYCLSQNFVRRGFRKKKRERVQLYLCKTCAKTFTPHLTKGKHYPLEVIFDALSLYNLGYSLEKVCRIINGQMVKWSNGSNNHLTIQPFNYPTIQPSSLSNWISEFADRLPFLRLRYFVLKKYSPEEMAIYATLAHQQLFRYRFHRAKCDFIIKEDFKHRRFGPLKEFLEMVPAECPHHFFSRETGSRSAGQKGLRASEVPMTFSKKQMIVRAKQNYATEACQFVLQSVKERKRRHDALQRFMFYNDSVTVATEVPVYLTRDDLLHMQTQLGFEMYNKNGYMAKWSNGHKKDQPCSHETMQPCNSTMKPFNHNELPKLITGHIDILQIRNGQIHILDYKPKAEKGQPIEQLTLYAMALSRLTGLRLFEFKCAWFDENDYFEFYPLHVIYKPKKRLYRRKIKTQEGVYLINRIKEKIEKIRPI